MGILFSLTLASGWTLDILNSLREYKGIPLQVRLTPEWLLDLDTDRRVRNIGKSYGANCSAGIKPSKSKTKTTDNWGEHIIIYSSFEYQSYNKSYHYIPASYHPNLPWLRKREGKNQIASIRTFIFWLGSFEKITHITTNNNHISICLLTYLFFTIINLVFFVLWLKRLY